MIPSSLLIKIFGVAVAGFLTIGVPVIVSAKKASRQKEIDDSFSDFLKTATTSFEFHPGETFSDKAFTNNWTPTEEEQKYISTNWQNIIPKMPGKFFKPYLSTIATKPILTSQNTCYLKISYATNETIRNQNLSDLKVIYAPFSKDKLTASLKNRTTVILRMEKMVLDKIQYLSYKSSSSTGTIESQDKDISFFDSLYETTLKHIKKLSFTQAEVVPSVWSYNSEHCSTDAASSASK